MSLAIYIVVVRVRIYATTSFEGLGGGIDERTGWKNGIKEIIELLLQLGNWAMDWVLGILEGTGYCERLWDGTRVQHGSGLGRIRFDGETW